jgi:hypothetical protein
MASSRLAYGAPMACAFVVSVATSLLEGFWAQAQWNVAQAAIENIANVRKHVVRAERGGRLIRVTLKTTWKAIWAGLAGRVIGRIVHAV